MVLAVAALGLGIGAIVLGSLTAPTQEAASLSTTTTTTDDVEQPIDLEDFTVAEIERGTKLDWEHDHSVTDGSPLALLEHAGWTYVFANDTGSAGHSPGTRAWRTSDGVVWESLGRVIGADHVVNNIQSTQQGLIASEAGLGGADFTLWRSNDGIEWSSEVIAAGDRGTNTTRYGHAIGGNDHILVVTATRNVDITPQIEERLGGVLGDGIDFSRLPWGPEFDDGELSIVVWGPLSFPIIEVSGEELGLSDEEMVVLEESWYGPGPEIEAWVSVEPGQWFRAEIPDASWINSITATPGAEILATGGDHQSNRVWSSADGFNWEKIDPLLGPDSIEVWNDRLVGPLQAGVTEIVTSVDGAEWETIGPGDYLPWQIQWSVGAMASGAGGIAANLNGWSSSTFAQPEPVVLTDGEATLTVDYSTGSYRVEAGEISRDWSMHTSNQPEGVVVDLANNLLTFHAVSGVELASFSFEKLMETESEFWSSGALDTQHDAFVFTPDGRDWTIQDAREIMEGSIALLEVTDNRVVAVVSPQGRSSPTAPPGFEIWSAPIP